MTIREKQDEFISEMEIFDNFPEKFNYLVSLSEELPVECPEHLFSFRIEGCQSRTCVKVYRDGNNIYFEGWSNSTVMGGIIVSIMQIFNQSEIREFQDSEIDFHIKSGLIDNLTPMRRAALEEIIRRINVLLPQLETSEI
jgi:cysteine desulfuration protein SufE